MAAWYSRKKNDQFFLRKQKGKYLYLECLPLFTEPSEWSGTNIRRTIRNLSNRRDRTKQILSRFSFPEINSWQCPEERTGARSYIKTFRLWLLLRKIEGGREIWWKFLGSSNKESCGSIRMIKTPNYCSRNIFISILIKPRSEGISANLDVNTMHFVYIQFIL